MTTDFINKFAECLHIPSFILTIAIFWWTYLYPKSRHALYLILSICYELGTQSSFLLIDTIRIYALMLITTLLLTLLARDAIIGLLRLYSDIDLVIFLLTIIFLQWSLSWSFFYLTLVQKHKGHSISHFSFNSLYVIRFKILSVLPYGYFFNCQ
jgi:hypothetical protein